MTDILASNFRVRKSFSKIKKLIEIPDLIEIQKKSYELFLQKNVDPDKRENTGLQGVFKSVYPIKDFNGTSSLEFVKYTLDKPKYDVLECKERGMTYAAPVRVVIRLVIWDIDETSGAQSIRDIKEQEIYFGEIPLMTETGTFIVNGTERVVVSQLHRSPGVFFDHDAGKSQAAGKVLYSGRIIPYRGSWIDFEFDTKDLLYVRIDRRKKIPATVFLKALGYSAEDLLNYFYKSEHITLDGSEIYKSVDVDLLPGQIATRDVKNSKTNEVIIREGKKITKFAAKKLELAKIKEIQVDFSGIVGEYASYDIVNPKTGEIILECNHPLTEDVFGEIKKAGIKEFDLIYIDNINICASLRETLLVDKVESTDGAMLDIYKKMRPGEPPTIEMSKTFFNNLFFNAERYDLSRVGRLKINHKFGFEDVPLDLLTLRREDILAVVKYMLELKNGTKDVDDIDHLGNRRVKSVGELVENQYRIGLVRMERAIKERMSLQDIETLMPHELVNAKPVQAVLKEFFGSSQLSQFMDQTNPLAEITHKRRLSALGPGGMTREHAGFEVRDVHTTHYGRICPIETPEGPNIGLISSLSSYARVNDYGFIETPYRKVTNGRVADEVVYLSALEEEKYVIAQANAELDPKGYFVADLISARKAGESIFAPKDEVNLMDVSPNQLVSVAASIIPFLEHDDANRALMGSNMQRQGVPLIKTSAPIVGTDMEQRVAKDSGVTVVAKHDGVVTSVDAARIVVKVTASSKDDSSEVDIYNLIKYKKSNQNTCVNQVPIVKKDDKVKKGDVIADGMATEVGELALGKNILVAFMPWRGYNFEDSILVSERLVRNDAFTSIHIEEFECIARDTKLGKEEITRDIPNVSEELLADLDGSGIVRIGAEVKPGHILVGKVTPKGETQLSPEEKLLRAIFGEKAGDVKDTSLRVTPGVSGTVIAAQVFSREGIEKDNRAKDIEDSEVQKLLVDQEDEMKIIKDVALSKVLKLLIGKKSASKIFDEDGNVFINKGEILADEKLKQIDIEDLSQLSVADGDKIEDKIETILKNMSEQLDLIKMVFEDKIDKLKKGDELPPGVIKIVKVFIAVKRKLSVGDKMAGRHGNKGVISKVVPVEDMPFMEDGTPIDIVLNPLGVPSRMNVGQILEAHLGWAVDKLGKMVGEMIDKNTSPDEIRKFLKKIYKTKEVDKLLDDASDKVLVEFARKLSLNGIHVATPVFDGAFEEEIDQMLEMAGLPKSGQTVLRDGKTGKRFEQNVTVGIMYMMKLNHLVADKIHARSIGPYSLVTQQPLGGKAQFGGQKLGEMEVWALEAYGAAHILQEFLTVKSDDISGRVKAYESIVKGETDFEVGIPESFNVLMKELQGLGLHIDLVENDGVAPTVAAVAQKQHGGGVHKKE